MKRNKKVKRALKLSSSKAITDITTNIIRMTFVKKIITLNKKKMGIRSIVLKKLKENREAKV